MVSFWNTAVRAFTLLELIPKQNHSTFATLHPLGNLGKSERVEDSV